MSFIKEHIKSQFKKDLNQYGELGRYLNLTIKYGWMVSLFVSFVAVEFVSLVGAGELALLNLTLLRNYDFLDILQIGLGFLLFWVSVSAGICVIVFVIILWLPKKFMVPMDADGRYCPSLPHTRREYIKQKIKYFE